MRLAFSVIALMAIVLVNGCGTLPKAEEHQQVYQLLPPDLFGQMNERLNANLMVTRLTSRPGYDSSSMAYRLSDYELSYFASNRWAERPTRMLHPALVSALDDLGPFRNVISSQSGIPADYRLDTELVRLEQDFRRNPSHTHLALHFQLTNEEARRIVLNRTLSATQPAPSETPEGGVIAANAALEELVRELSTLLWETLKERE